MIKVVKNTYFRQNRLDDKSDRFFTLSKIEVRDIMKPTDVGVSNHADA